MNVDEKDQRRFRTAARQLADRLRYLTVPGLRTGQKIEPVPDDNGGWSTTIARRAGHDLAIEVALDKYTAWRTGRTFWVGFWSRRLQSVEAMLKDLPRDLRPSGHTLRDGDGHHPGNDESIFVLKAPLSEWMFRRPLLEDYSGYYKFFGFYDRAAALDLDYATDFLECVMSYQASADDEEEEGIAKIRKRKNLFSTQKKTLILAGRGQGKFRDGLKTIWKGCPIIGLRSSAVLRASHI